ncbi:MAG: AI-2E family transporter [Lachnospiraceae bacterium]|nr:AI-2E family transporter [Lachnospiraceae bacterium]
MKVKIDKKYLQFALVFFFTAIAILLVFFFIFRYNSFKGFLNRLNGILAPVFYGFIFAYLMTPLLNLIENKCLNPIALKIKTSPNTSEKQKSKRIRFISVTLTFIIVFLFVYLFFKSVVPELYNSIYNIISSYSVYTNNLVNWLNQVMRDNPDVAKFLGQLIQNYSEETDNFLNDVVMPAIQSLLIPNINSWIVNISASIIRFIHVIWNIIVGLIISIYVLSGKEKFSRGAVRLSYACFERQTANKLIESVRFTHHTFIGFLGGKVIDSLIIGILCYFGCLIFKFPFAVLVSVVIGVTNIIPFFGPYIGAIPTTIIILMVDPMKALYFVIFILVLQQVDGNFIGPMILSESTGLSSFWIIFSITLFGGLWGVPGMIVGVPVTAVLFAGINSLTDGWLIKKNLPTDPKSYNEVGSITDDGEFTHYEYVKNNKKPKKNNIIYKCGKAIGNFFVAAFCKIKEFLQRNKGQK